MMNAALALAVDELQRACADYCRRTAQNDAKLCVHVQMCYWAFWREAQAQAQRVV